MLVGGLTHFLATWVQVVGYNATGGIGADGTFIKLKNSWGEDWGEGGYM